MQMHERSNLHVCVYCMLMYGRKRADWGMETRRPENNNNFHSIQLTVGGQRKRELLLWPKGLFRWTRKEEENGQHSALPIIWAHDQNGIIWELKTFSTTELAVLII